MKILKFPFALAFILAFAASCFAQNEDANNSTNIPTKNPSALFAARAAARRALASQDTDAAELSRATTPTTGKLVISVKIDVNPGLPTTAKIDCTATAVVGEATPPQVSFQNDGTVVATRAGNSATCTITLPYGWFLATPTKDIVGIGVVVTATTGTLGTPPFTLATSTTELTIPVPANGATTTENITTSI